MRVNLISFTPDALNLLLRTKNTRLSSDDDPAYWDDNKKADHLLYMQDTIKSSWEFIDYTFQISEVTRVFTHQLVRTRTGSYAQQAMRVVDARAFEVQMPDSVAAVGVPGIWSQAVAHAREAYAQMVDSGMPVQDARGILPNNVETSILAKFNLRTLHDTAKLRMCTRAQGEYQNVFAAMRRLVIDVHPWAAPFIEVHCVATGTCAFPRYGKKECPVYLPEMDNTAVREAARAIFWAPGRKGYEATPTARDGKAM